MKSRMTNRRKLSPCLRWKLECLSNCSGYDVKDSFDAKSPFVRLRRGQRRFPSEI